MIPLNLFKTDTRNRVVAIGELLVEFIPTDPNGLLNQNGTMIKTASGSSGIFACASAKFKNKTGIICQVGKDSLSEFVLNTVKSEGIDTDQVKISDEGQIGISFVEYVNDGRNFQFYRQDSVGSKLSVDSINEQYIKESAAIHFPGMLLELSESMREVCIQAVKIAKENDVIVSFDPNIRKELILKSGAVERLKWVISQADVISPTLEEAKFITGKEDIIDIIDELHNIGPKFIAITRDKNGAVISSGREIILLEGMNVAAIDPTGAGDTFAAALLSGILCGWDLVKIGKFSNCAGAVVTLKQGTIGLAVPTKDEVEKFVEAYQCKVKFLRKEEDCKIC
jgi:sugar/nucleoside kinase (ribokinase family)